jgi:hypothetical protein
MLRVLPRSTTQLLAGLASAELCRFQEKVGLTLSDMVPTTS